jgi:hypothetical protein
MGIGKTLAVEDQSALIPRENEQGLLRNKMRKEAKGPCPIASVAPNPLPVLCEVGEEGETHAVERGGGACSIEAVFEWNRTASVSPALG